MPGTSLIAGEDFDVALAEAQLPLRKGEFSIESAEDGRFVVGFPPVGDGDLLKITFTTSVLRFGQGFAGRAWLVDPSVADEGQLPQLVVPGNAAQLGAADVDPRPVGSEDLTAVDNNLAVRIAIKGSLLGQLQVTPEDFYPQRRRNQRCNCGPFRGAAAGRRCSAEGGDPRSKRSF